MAGSLSEIKAKIISTEKTSKITSAMRMVSSAKLVKSEQAARDFQIYASKIRQITTDLLKSELTIGSIIRCWCLILSKKQAILSSRLIKDLLEVTIQKS